MIRNRTLASRGLPGYFVLAYAISWSFWIPLVGSRRGDLPWEVPRAFDLLGGAGPLIAAVLLTALSRGVRGVRELLALAVRWRTHVLWYGIAIFWPAALALAVIAAVKGTGLPLAVSVAPLPAIGLSLARTTVVLFVEEIGWRGFALPRLQMDRSALRASILVGLAWGPWHLPYNFMPGRPVPFGSPLLGTLIQTLFTIVFSVVLTWIFNSTRGSVLVVTLAHAAFNTMNLRGIQVAPADLFQLAGLVALAVIAAALVWVFGARDLSRRSKIELGDIHP